MQQVQGQPLVLVGQGIPVTSQQGHLMQGHQAPIANGMMIQQNLMKSGTVQCNMVSPFMVFLKVCSNGVSQTVRGKNPMHLVELSCILYEQWNQLPELQKAPYIKLAQQQNLQIQQQQMTQQHQPAGHGAATGHGYSSRAWSRASIMA